jgi:hypothetical protein
VHGFINKGGRIEEFNWGPADAEFASWKKERNDVKTFNQTASTEKFIHKMQNLCIVSVPMEIFHFTKFDSETIKDA